MNEEVSRSADQWWDCHFHIFDSARYQLAPGCAYVPEDAPLDTFRDLCLSRGVQRAVLVHPSVYGADHSSFEDALVSNGDWLRGVAVVYPDQAITSDSQIERWDQLGACGTRINRLFPGSPDDVDSVIDRVKPLGWHVQVLIDIVEDIDIAKQITARGVPVVVDHFGHHPVDELLRSSAFANLLSLMREGIAWVKLSGGYRVERTHGPWSSLLPVVDELARANDKRLVWGSDWPHPPSARHPFPHPEDIAIGHTIRQWLTHSELVERVMHENPAVLYGTRTLPIPI
jgi:predicted TIM-barrel fold metal-dependent hydrolase